MSSRRNIIVEDGETKKWCPKCKTYRGLVAFREHRERPDGLYPKCRMCVKADKVAKRDKSANSRRNKRAKQVRRARRQGADVFVISHKDMTRLLQKPCRYESDECWGIMTLDHIVPLSRGGSHGIGNLTMLCSFHNSAKNDRLHTEYAHRLRFDTDTLVVLESGSVAPRPLVGLPRGT
jgi:5-methylcytosine-specific restriction endonuclease McrA